MNEHVKNRYRCYKSQIDNLVTKLNDVMDGMVYFSIRDAVDFWEWYSDNYYCAEWLSEDTDALDRIDANLIVKWHSNE